VYIGRAPFAGTGFSAKIRKILTRLHTNLQFFWIYSLSQFDLLKTKIDQKEANQTKKKLGTRK